MGRADEAWGGLRGLRPHFRSHVRGGRTTLSRLEFPPIFFAKLKFECVIGTCEINGERQGLPPVEALEQAVVPGLAGP